MAAKKKTGELHPSLRCMRCLSPMLITRAAAQRCEECEGKPWPSCPQFVLAEETDREELSRVCDRDESAAWLEMERVLELELVRKSRELEELERVEREARGRRRMLEEQLAEILSVGLPERTHAELMALRLAEIRRELQTTNGDAR